MAIPVHDRGRGSKAQGTAGAAVKTAQPIAEPPQRMRTARVTFIEDDPDIFAAYLGLFGGGVEVSPATPTTSVAAAIEIIRLERPDVLVTDLHLGSGDSLDGVEIAKTIRAEMPATTVILCSGTTEDVPPDERRYFDEILDKPVDADRLENAIRNGLALPRIAVFDDSQEIVALCARHLRRVRAGRTVNSTAVTSVESAIAVFERELPPIVITDLSLTLFGTEGFEILRRIREIAPATKVILFSGACTDEEPDKELLARVGGAGFDATFNKSQIAEMVRYIEGLKAQP